MLLTYITPNVGLPVLKPDGTTALDVVFQALTNITAPNNYLWDFNGDGTGDLQCTVSPVATGRFTTQGIYLPTVTLTDSQGKQYKDTTIVNVMNRDDMGAMFKMIWNRMKTNMLAGKIEAALNDHSGIKQDRYRGIMNKLSNEQRTWIFSTIYDLKLHSLYDDYSETGALRNVEGEILSYPVQFIKEDSGLWKIYGY